MPKITVNISYGSQDFPSGSTFTRSVVELRKAADGVLAGVQNVAPNVASCTFDGLAPGTYNVSCQPMSGDSQIGSPVSKQYTVLADVALVVPVSLA